LEYSVAQSLRPSTRDLLTVFLARSVAPLGVPARRLPDPGNHQHQTATLLRTSPPAMAPWSVRPMPENATS